MARKVGKIDISELNVPPNKNELQTAKFFADRGKEIRFIRPSNIKGDHKADFWMDGMRWEVKNPHGTSARTIESNLRTAIEQSNNIIFDLRKMGKYKTNAIYRLKTEFIKRKQIQKLRIIINSDEMLEFDK